MKFLKAKSQDNPLEAALEYLDHQAYSEQQMVQKLKAAGFSETAIQECLSRLNNWNYLNDRKFGEARIHQLQVRLKSRAFVIFDLENHGLNHEIISELMDAYYPEEYELEIAKTLKNKKATPSKPEIKVRVYLVRNGFSENTVRQCFPSIDPT